MAHEHIVVDTDTHLVIDKATREISTKSGNAIIMQYDHNSERFTFDLPRMIDGHDMMQCNQVQVHYINIGATEEETNADVYDVVDLAVSTEDESTVVFSWLISGNATKFAGVLNFLIKFNCVVDGVVEYAWNTAIYNSVTVSNGMNNGEAIAEKYPDILAAWEARIEALERGGGSQSDWHAKEGEPGHVLNRTHYENGTEMKTLFDQTITVANNAWQGSGIVNLVDGNTYTVVWDGTTYECVAFATVFNVANAIALGNPYLMGVGENNNQPFVFGWAYEYGMLASGSMTNGVHTIKITEEVKVYKKLDECYLPSGLMPYILKVYAVILENGVPQDVTANVGVRFDIVAETLWNGGRVVLDFTGTELTNEGIYKAEVVEWWLRPQTNGTNAIVLWYLYKGKPTSYSVIGGTWTPPTT